MRRASWRRSLYLLSGEIHQARRTPDDLNKAVADFEKALATGQETSATVVVRLAQIDVQLGRVRPGARANRRTQWLKEREAPRPSSSPS